MKIDLGTVAKISARVAFAILISCLFFLFFPSDYLPFDIVGYREKFGIWVFIALVISLSLLISYIVKWIAELIKKELNRRKTWSNYKYVLKNLSNEEKSYLKNFYDRRKTAITIDLSDPVAKKLETFRVISMAAGANVASMNKMPGFIQPWVFKILDKNPEYLTLKETEYGDEKNNG